MRVDRFPNVGRHNVNVCSKLDALFVVRLVLTSRLLDSKVPILICSSALGPRETCGPCAAAELTNLVTCKCS